MTQNNYHEYLAHKFGGSSLANADRFIALKSLLTGKKEIIVASAIQGTTSILQEILDAAREGKSFTNELENLEALHVTLAHSLLSENSSIDIISSMQKDFTEIKDILHAVQLTTVYSKAIQDLILGYGEIWSSKILAQHLSEKSHRKRSECDAPRGAVAPNVLL